MAYHPVHHYYTYCDDTLGYGSSSPIPIPPGVTPPPGWSSVNFGYGYHSPMGWGRGPVLEGNRVTRRVDATDEHMLVEALPG